MLSNPQKTFCSLSKGIAGNIEIESMMGDEIRHIRFGCQLKATDSMLTWGRKHKLYDRSARLARSADLPLLHLEDGFLCFVDPPSQGGKRHSLIIDDIGIYYDATRPSRLEKLISESHNASDEQIKLAEDIRLAIINNRISKYNHQGFAVNEKLEQTIAMAPGEKILVIDQTRSDASIIYGLANEQSFATMLSDAIKHNPDATIFVKIHPDIKLGVKNGHFCPDDYKQHHNIIFIEDDCNPHHLLSLMDKVYVVTSQMGFEALMHKLPVHTYGMPFYAGWALTNDLVKCERRTCERSLQQLIDSCLKNYCRYFEPRHDKKNPESTKAISVRNAIRLLAVK